jgi:hypothetical protein
MWAGSRRPLRSKEGATARMDQEITEFEVLDKTVPETFAEPQ